jgi:hypothetical protein
LPEQEELFTLEDVDDELAMLAEAYAWSYDGRFWFMIKMRNLVHQRKRLSPGQVVGVLNCMQFRINNEVRNPWLIGRAI